MEKKLFTVAILGVGSRGTNYGRIMQKNKEQFKIVALCDLFPAKLKAFGEEVGVDENQRFVDENEFFKEKRADLLVIGTQDADHVRHCLRAFEVGYDVLLEKPITDKKEEAEALLAAQKKYGCKALVCHVLRYAPAYVKIKELIDGGAIGKLIHIDALERVAYWHQGHSYVRGNWRTSKTATPMILAKCCHDLDYLQWYIGSKCTSVSSMGELRYFKSENAPEGATERCVTCPHGESCPYSAKNIYIKRWKNHRPARGWPFDVIAPAPLTEEKLQKAIEEGPYGRCVFRCDNDVVDHQVTLMQFENGVQATLTMTAFTGAGGRFIRVYGSKADILYDGHTEKLTLHHFGEGEQPVEIDYRPPVSNEFSGHGGGDAALIAELAAMLNGGANLRTSLEASLESHLMGIAAEESRLKGGELIYVHK